MADRCCIYCNDEGDCWRCSYFFQPDRVHDKCGRKWSDHAVLPAPGYPAYAACPPKES